MATINDSAAPSNSTDAFFRAWAQVIHDAFDTSGWINTADTGQIDLTTAVAPGAANTKVGYEVWRMDDALQATAPVFVKIWYGSGGATNRPGVWIEVGEGSTGAGVLTGRLWNGRPPSGTATDAPIASAGDSTSVSNCYGGGDTNRIVLGMFEPVNDNAAGNRIIICIERLKNADGTDSDEGVVVLGSQSGTLNRIGTFLFGVYNNQPIGDSLYVVMSGSIITPLAQNQIHAAYINPTLRHLHNKITGIILIGGWNPGWTTHGTAHPAGEARGEFVHDPYGVDIDYRSFGMNTAVPTSQTALFPAVRYD